ncbi:MAG: branched-chain amino acid ABC transporter permease [Spirochaetales bacterium]|nr:branched-chain amino acid ABC transporter permease [Spirochaetales bacterium]
MKFSKPSPHLKKILIVVGMIFLIGFPFFIPNPYIMRIAIMCGIYMVLASSLNIVIGFTGMFSLGHGAFYGIGAYTSALLALNLNWPFWITLPMGGIVAAFFGVLIGVATLRLRQTFLAFTTLGFGEITRILILNWDSLTRGPMGLPGIPIPTFFGVRFSQAGYYYFILMFTFLVVVFIYRIYHSRIGRAFIAIREDELAASHMGIHLFGYKTLAFTLACALAGLAGAFYAHFARFISADQFGGNESFAILTMVALGGTGSIIGPLIGAAVLVLFPEVFRFLAQFRMVIYGAILIFIIVVKPGGLAGVRGVFEKPVSTFRGKRRKGGR